MLLEQQTISGGGGGQLACQALSDGTSESEQRKRNMLTQME